MTTLESRLADYRAQIERLTREAACPCCTAGIVPSGETCRECHGKGLAIIAYETVRAHLKAKGEECERLRGELGKSGQLGVLIQEGKDAFNEDRHHLGHRIDLLEARLSAAQAERDTLAEALVKAMDFSVSPQGTCDGFLRKYYAAAIVIARRITG